MKFSKRIGHWFPYLLILLVAGMILIPQIINHAYFMGSDGYFHMSRAYETAMQFKTGHFSYFLSLFSFNRTGRVVNAVYGPLGGYFMGLVLLLTKNWFNWEITMSFLVLFVAGSLMFKLGRYWHVSPVVNFLISILYMLSDPIMNFVFNQTFLSVGAALTPLVILMGSKILRRRISFLKLALVMTLILEIHTLTFLISVIVITICALVALFAWHHPGRLILELFKSAVLTMLLTFNFWGSTLELWFSNHGKVLLPNPNSNMNEGTSGVVEITKNLGVNDPSVLGLLSAGLIVLAIILYLVNIFKTNYMINTIMLGFGIVFLWMSTNFFPWRTLQRKFTFLDSLVQYPMRFLPVSLVSIYLILGVLISSYNGWQNRKDFYSVALLILVSLIGFNSVNIYNTFENHVRTYQSRSVISWFFINKNFYQRPNEIRQDLTSATPGAFLDYIYKPVPDYIPTDQHVNTTHQYQKVIDPYVNYRLQLCQNRLKSHVNSKILNRNEPVYTFKVKKAGQRIIPWVKYQRMKIWFNGRMVRPRITSVGAMILRCRKGFNRLAIKYVPGWQFYTGMWISILSWLLLIIISLIRS